MICANIVNVLITPLSVRN